MERSSWPFVIAVGAALAFGFLFANDCAFAAEQTVPSFESLRLEAWSPQNDFRPIRNLRTDGHVSIGFNEEFIWGVMQSSGMTCRDCATNSPPVLSETARAYLDVLSTNDVKIAREAVPERFISNPNGYGPFEEILKEYQQRNFTVVIVLVWPVAGPQPQCYGFGGADATLDRAAYDYSASMARLILHMRIQPGVDRQWLETHVLIEPWNEFDGMCKGTVGSPQKAARYQGIMQRVFDRAGLRNEVLMPSIVNVFRVDALTAGKTGRFGKMKAYLSQYYMSGGSGRPNIHLYFDPHWSNRADHLAQILGAEIASLNEFVPQQYKGTVLIGETGIALTSDVPKCNAHAMPGPSRVVLYKDMVESPALDRGAQAILFWRLFGLKDRMPDASNCDQFYGVTNNEWPSVATPKDALSTFMPGGRDLLNAANKRK